MGVFDNKTVITLQCSMSLQEMTIDAIIDCVSSSPLKVPVRLRCLVYLTKVFIGNSKIMS